MAMLRSMTTRKSPHAYKQLIKDEESHDLFEPKFSRTSSVPSSKNGVFGSPFSSSSSSSSSRRTSAESQAKSQAKQAEKASKIHPIFSLFNTGRKSNKGATARPEFSRYMQYLKEGGFGGVIDIAAAKSTVPGN